MLSTFKIRNFRSILDMDVDFSFAEGKAPNNYQEFETHTFLEPRKNHRVVPCLALYGANASGKTNILKALATLQSIFTSDVDSEYEPNLINRKYESTLFELSFFTNNKDYVYSLEYDNKEILKESLKSGNTTYFTISKNSCAFSEISKGSYTKERLKEILNVECKNESHQQKRSFLHRIHSQYAGLNTDMTLAAHFIESGIQIYFGSPPFPTGVEKLGKALGNTDSPMNDDSFNRVTQLLQKLDIDICKMTFDQESHQGFEEMKESIKESIKNRKFPSFIKREGKDSFIAHTIHTWHIDTEGKEIPFNFREESDGTQSVSGLLGVFLATLELGGTVIVDELDRSLHPYLLIQLVRLFKDKRYNKKNAQLIFTTHCTDLLDDDILRISEVGIINKTLNTGSTIKRISDFDGMRNVLNFRKQYLSGMLSGIPHPYI